MTNENLILQKLDELSADVKKNRDEISEVRVEQARQGTRLETHLEGVSDRKLEERARWMIGGIIGGWLIGAAGLIASLFK